MKPQRMNDGTPDPKIPRGWRILSATERLRVGDRWFDFDKFDCKWWQLESVSTDNRYVHNYGLVIRKKARGE